MKALVVNIIKNCHDPHYVQPPLSSLAEYATTRVSCWFHLHFRVSMTPSHRWTRIYGLHTFKLDTFSRSILWLFLPSSVSSGAGNIYDSI